MRHYEMLVRVDEFGVAHTDLFPGSSPGGEMFAKIDAIVNEVRSHFVAQDTGDRDARNGTTAKIAVGETLRSALAVISRTARTVVAATPGLIHQFRLPRSESDQRLLSAAKAILVAVAPLRDRFVAHNLPATFVDDLNTTIGAFEDAITRQSKAKESRAGARAEIRKKLSAALATVNQLDPVVVNRLKDNAGLLAEWKSARHVSRLTVPYPKTAKPTPPLTPAPSAA